MSKPLLGPIPTLELGRYETITEIAQFYEHKIFSYMVCRTFSCAIRLPQTPQGGDG